MSIAFSNSFNIDTGQPLVFEMANIDNKIKIVPSKYDTSISLF